jgi:hypothetical protein
MERQARDRAAHANGAEASIRRYCFGGVVAGAAGVAVGGLVVAGAIDSVVWLRGQNTAATTITTTITATIAYQKRLSPKKFIITCFMVSGCFRVAGCSSEGYSRSRYPSSTFCEKSGRYQPHARGPIMSRSLVMPLRKKSLHRP